MADEEDLGDVEAYILSSKYRSHVIEHLAETARATPEEIAESVDAPRPHISRALSELQEEGVVELQVSEGRTVGRYYGLTEDGEAAWPEIKKRIRSVEWSIEEPSTAVTRAIVELAEEEFGEWLRFVTLYDGDELTILYADPEALASYTDEEFEEGLRTFIFDHSLDEITLSGDECWSEVLHFSDVSVIRIRVRSGQRVAFSFDSTHDVLVPKFAESVIDIFEAHSLE